MRARGVGTVAILLVGSHATRNTIVDDVDTGIEYRGAWVKNTIQNPNPNDFAGGSVTFTNTTGSTATYRFAGTGIGVYGALAPGTFVIHSTYSIDSGEAVDYLPPNTIVTVLYHQKFFQSETLSDGDHTLVITNEGEEFWLDYFMLTQASQTTTTAATSTSSTTTSQEAQTTTSSTTQSSPSSTSSGHPETTSIPSSQIQTTRSLPNTNNVALTSTDAAVLSPPPTGIIPQSQTSTLVSTIPSPISAPARVHSATISAGVIAGFAAAGLLIIILVGIVGWKCCRHRQKPAGRGDLAPYDPGLTALSFESSKKQELECDSDSRDSRTTSLLSLPIQPAHLQAPEENMTSMSSGECGVTHEIRDYSLSGTTTGGDQPTGFEALGSPSSASALQAWHPREIPLHKGSPVTPRVDRSSYRSSFDHRRRSIDAGVRIAGGPLGGLRHNDMDGDVRSELSTLPPSYQMYNAI